MDLPPAGGDAPPPSRCALFVYYRVAEAQLEAATAAASAFHQGLAAASTGLTLQLWRRPEIRDGQLTLMEVWQHEGGIDAVLRGRIAAPAGGACWWQGERHVEAFLPL